MKQNFIFFLILTAALISCKDTAKKETKVKSPDTTSIKNTESETAASSEFQNVYFMKSERIAATDELKKHVGTEIDSVEVIDFTGDKIPDYICRTKMDSTGVGSEYWLKSDYKTIKKTKYYFDGFSYRWFINLDNDPEPEIYQVNGDEDGADYTIVDQNLQTGKDKILLYINPVIIENQKKYWGYAWDISNIKARKNGTNIELFCSLNHGIERDGNEETDPKSQKQMPVLFFSGHHTQESGKMNIKDEQWLSLAEIIKQTKR